ncbi:MAG TPA: TIGR03067 domain-containing protein [Planctomycetaceae bacterium]|nr:TIGR03067 domain-containing protein [Planctomycetaceae bacterium]
MGSKPALLLSLMLLAGTEGSQAAPPKDLDRLQGDWTMVSGRVDGVDSVVKPDGMRCAVRGEKVSFLHDGKVVEQVTIKLDPAKTPKAIDATLATKQVAPGIYRLNEGTFTLCYTAPGKERPSDFAAKAGTGHKLSVWKRPAKPKG